MKSCNAYENGEIREITGETLRPGGFKLTEKSISFCKFSTGDAILDLGCAVGATVGYLNEFHNIKAVGMDKSEKLITIAKEKYGFAEFLRGKGEHIPFEDEKFNGVFAECTLSLMDDLDKTLKEVFRVLKNNGWVVISDVYAKDPAVINELNRFSISSCVRGLHDLDLLCDKLGKIGFKIMLLEDCSHLLKELLLEITFAHGSMADFWNKTTDNSIDGCEFQEALKTCKPGYFLLIAKKGAISHG